MQVNKSIASALAVTVVLVIAAAVFIASCIVMPGENPIGELEPLNEEQQQLAETLRTIVVKLADDIGERHYQEPLAYRQAGDFIDEQFRTHGMTPYAELFGDKEQYRNIVAEHYGVQNPEEVVLIGAHYDTVWMTPGADDNASGVAVMLELAGKIVDMSLKRSVRFVAFANEEWPHYMTEEMGSLYHARRAYERGEQITAMFSLEMLGYYSDEPKSQNYPKPFSWIYPDVGNFIAFVSNYKSRTLLRHSLGLFRASGQMPAEGLAAPVMLVSDVRRSDQVAFWRYGYPGVMVTDTAGFRNFGYHNVSDVPQSLNYEHMSRVLTGLLEVIVSIANR